MAEETNTDVVENVQEDALLENQEVVEETTEDSKEVSLDETVLKVLIGESTEENEEEVEEISEESEEAEELEEAKHSKKKEAAHKDDEEDEDEDEVKEMAHSKKKKNEEEDDEEEDEDDIEEGAHEDDEEDEDEKEEQAPKTKSESLNRLYKEMKGMRKSQLENALESVTEIICAQHESVEDDDNDAIAATVAAIKKSANDAKGKTKGDMLSAAYGMMKSMKKHNLQSNYGKLMSQMVNIKKGKMDESFDLESEIDLLVQADSNLTEDFKGKASIIFEAAINNKVVAIKESLQAQYESDLQEELGHVRETLVEKIDDYLTYVVEDWIDANAETVDSELRSEITEDFMKGLHSLFTESYIDVPESKRDLISELQEENQLVKESLEQTESDKEDIAEKYEELLRNKIISEQSSELTSTQAAKLVGMLEGAEFVSEEDFTEKVKTLKATFFGQEEEIKEVTSGNSEVEVVVEGEVEKSVPNGMAKYVDAITRMKNNSSHLS